jgi:hypothetical protein
MATKKEIEDRKAFLNNKFETSGKGFTRNGDPRKVTPGRRFRSRDEIASGEDVSRKSRSLPDALKSIRAKEEEKIRKRKVAQEKAKADKQKKIDLAKRMDKLRADASKNADTRTGKPGSLSPNTYLKRKNEQMGLETTGKIENNKPYTQAQKDARPYVARSLPKTRSEELNEKFGREGPKTAKPVSTGTRKRPSMNDAVPGTRMSNRKKAMIDEQKRLEDRKLTGADGSNYKSGGSVKKCKRDGIAIRGRTRA